MSLCNYTFDEVKQLVVLLAVIVFGLIILIMSYIYPLEFNNEYLIMLNLIIGALIGIVSPQAAKSLSNITSKSIEDVEPVDEVESESKIPFVKLVDNYDNELKGA